MTRAALDVETRAASEWSDLYERYCDALFARDTLRYAVREYLAASDADASRSDSGTIERAYSARARLRGLVR